ncbi:MAG TPA: hypothetical protein VEB59_02460 [Gemmatimonadales bacterium]|nr:hypothetical protein [Gemmatimonadales bacterium]
MAQKRHYEVRYAFAARNKETNARVWITQAVATKIDDLLTPAQIKAQIEAGNLKDNGAVTAETAASERRSGKES